MLSLLQKGRGPLFWMHFIRDMFHSQRHVFFEDSRSTTPFQHMPSQNDPERFTFKHATSTCDLGTFGGNPDI